MSKDRSELLKRRTGLSVAVGIFVAGVACYALWSARQAEQNLTQAVDERLLVAARSLKFMLAPDFHDRALDEHSIGRDEETRNRTAISTFAEQTEFQYVYTLVEREGKFYFTAPTVTEEELQERESWYFYPYEDVPEEFVRAVRDREIVYATYQDQWGVFRSVAVPEVSPGGRLYLACADCDIGHLRQLRYANSLRSGLAALGFMGLCLPLILSFRYAYRSYSRQLGIANQQLRKAQGNLEQQVQERTTELARANNELQQEIGERQRTEEALRESERNLQSVFDVAPIALILVDGDQVIRKANKKAAYITGQGVEEIVGHPVGSGIGCPHAADEPSVCGQTPHCAACPYRQSLREVLDENTDFLAREFEMPLSVLGIEFYRWIRIEVQPLTLDGRRHAVVAIEDTTDRKLAEKERKENQERLELALHGAALGLWDWFVPTGEVVFNERWAEMLGYSLDELAPHIQTWRSLFHKDDTSTALGEMQAHLDGKKPFFEAEYRMKTRSGEWKWVLGRGRVVERDGTGKSIRVTGTHLDITERKIAEEQLRKAKEMAEEASRLKSQFVANVSHEIRTPLNCIMGFAEIIRGSDSLDTVHQQAHTILQESETLMTLINDLLDQGKIAAGKLVLERRPLDLNDLLERLSRTARIQSEAKGLAVETIIDPAVPRYVTGDALRLRQVLLNLVSNAIKFTERGSVTVRAEMLEYDAGWVRLRFLVVDTGIGIPKEKHEHIFQSFVQADGSTTRRYGGTGLGTTISRQLVELMGGQIGLESEVGRGSTFWFTVDLEVCAETPDAQEVVSLDGVIACPLSATGRVEARILLAEDYPSNQEVARLHLEGSGHTVTIAVNGQEAVSLCQNEAFDLILMDVQMPEMDGYDATRAIRTSGGWRSGVPIIGLTANADIAAREACLQSGMNEVITKPIRRQSLLGAVSRWLARQPGTDPGPGAATRPSDSREQSAGDEVPLDFAAAVEEFGDRKTVDQIVERFLQNVEGQIAILREAIEKQDADRLRRESHSIKGGAGTLEARPLANIARRLEELGKAGDINSAEAVLKELEEEFGRLGRYVAENAARTQTGA